MPRYVARPAAIHLDDPDHGLAATAGEIIVSDDQDFIETGLLDADGRKLYRRRQGIRLGFTED